MTSEQVLEKAISRDGTPIAMWRSGEGPPLVLIHGTTADHTRWNTVRAGLEGHATLFAMDRRGRGASGDGEGYRIENEFEDVAAVVDAVAHHARGPVDVLGHSYGALCALGAVEMTTNIRRLALYEPPVIPGDAFPPGLMQRLEALLAEGRREDVILTFFREVVRVPESQLAALRALPAWPARVDAAHTIPREEQGTMSFQFDRERLASLQTPTLLLDGSESPEFLRRSTAALAAVLPNVEVALLAGQQHAAMDTAPQLFTEFVVGYLAQQ
jgi:pimeloyl-ACP methyl ester carboxylesterase